MLNLDGKCILNPALYVAETETKGRAVFTSAALPAGCVIELSPVVVMSAAERVLLDKTLLHDYIFEWGENKQRCAMALGYLAIYNHSYESNCEYFMNYNEATIYIKTVRAINAYEELTLNYNGNYNDEAQIWFEAK